MYTFTLPHLTIITGSHTAAYDTYQHKHACQTGTPYTPDTFTRQRHLCPYDHIIVCDQVHGTDGITVADHNDPRQYQLYQQTGDYIITTHLHIACGIATADCVPIIVYHPHKPMIAAIHAGWRGLAHGVIDNALHAMHKLAPTSSSTLYAYIGPCARQCCYAVSESVIEQLATKTAGESWYRHDNAQSYVDLATCAKTQLIHHGMLSQQIFGGSTCTVCHPHMCSHRDNQTQYRHLTYAVMTN